MRSLKALSAIFLFIASTSYAGTLSPTFDIKIISMSGPSDPNHPNVVQLDFGDNTLNVGTCNKRFAGIFATDENSHLISLALAASIAGKPVHVSLDQNSSYFTHDNRCIISRISIEP